MWGYGYDDDNHSAFTEERLASLCGESVQNRGAMLLSFAIVFLILTLAGMGIELIKNPPGVFSEAGEISWSLIWALALEVLFAALGWHLMGQKK